MKKINLLDAVSYTTARIEYHNLEVETYISTDNLLPNKQGVIEAAQLPTSTLNTPKYIKDNILVSNIRPYLKKIYYATTEGGVSSDVLTFVVNEEYHPKFIFYSLFQDAFFEHMMAGSKGTKMPRGDKQQILEFQISSFKFSEQQKIASVLSALDDKIELNNQLNDNLEQQTKLLYDYWFVQFEFPNEDGKPYKSSGGKMVYNKQLKREIPEGWEVKELGEILVTKLGGTPSTKNNAYWSGSIPWLNSGEVVNFPLIETEKYISEEALENSSTNLLKEGSILLSITRHLRVTILGIDACINQSVVGIQETEKYKSSYIYFHLINDISRLMDLRTGAQQPHINKEIVDMSPFLCPNIEILYLYYNTSNSLISNIVNNSKQNQQLASLRDWLLPMLMNGQVKVE